MLPPDLVDLIKDFVWRKIRTGPRTFFWQRMDMFDGVDSSVPEPDPWSLPMVCSDF